MGLVVANSGSITPRIFHSSHHHHVTEHKLLDLLLLSLASLILLTVRVKSYDPTYTRILVTCTVAGQVVVALWTMEEMDISDCQVDVCSV